MTAEIIKKNDYLCIQGEKQIILSKICYMENVHIIPRYTVSLEIS